MSNPNPKVSLLIPFYGNRYHQWQRTWWFLQRQTYSNFNVWILDDGSDKNQDHFGHCRYLRIRPAGASPRSPNMALLAGYEKCDGDFIIVSCPEILVPQTAIERMVLFASETSRNVPLLYSLPTIEMQSAINTVDWKNNLDDLQTLPNFWAVSGGPMKLLNSEVASFQHHGGFTGQWRSLWDRIGFLPATEEHGQSDVYWFTEEVRLGYFPKFMKEIACYHQWHEDPDNPVLMSPRVQEAMKGYRP